MWPNSNDPPGDGGMGGFESERINSSIASSMTTDRLRSILDHGCTNVTLRYYSRGVSYEDYEGVEGRKERANGGHAISRKLVW